MTTREEREREFHDQRFSHGPRENVAKYYSVDLGKQAYQELIVAAGGPGVRVLEYGCGTGSLGLDLARRGAEVVGIDISPVALARARRRARRAELTATFVEMDAQQLELPDDSFDLVCGSGILHHLDLEVALTEASRVVRSDGRVIFVEPLGHNPLINLYRRLTPSMRTVDEAPLRMADLTAATSRRFGACRIEHFDLLALAAVPVRGHRWGGSLAARLHRVDRWLFDRSSIARRWAWVVVIELGSPREPGHRSPRSADAASQTSPPP